MRSDITLGDPGVIFVCDVGCCNYEELDIIEVGGLNLGWPCENGPRFHYAFDFVTGTAAGNDSILCRETTNYENPVEFTDPQLWTHRSDGESSFPVVGWLGGAIIGGTFYESESYPEIYQGAYFFADYTSQWIRILEIDDDQNIVGWNTFMEDADRPVAIQADPISGDLYYISWNQNEVRRILYDATVAVEDDLDTVFQVKQLRVSSYPNPFRRVVDFDFDLPVAASVSFRIYNPKGQLVRTLLEDTSFPAGSHTLEWDARAADGSRLNPGVYFCRVHAGERVSSTKVTVR